MLTTKVRAKKEYPLTATSSTYVCYTALFSTGERFPVLLYRDSYQPVILPTRYIIDERRENKKSGTLMRDIRVLRWFYEWCEALDIQIEQRFRAGEMLTKAEVTSFCRYLRASRTTTITGSINLLNEQEKGRIPILSPETFNSYISVIEDYLLWAAYEFIPVATPENTIRENLRAAVNRIKRAFRSNRKEGKSVSNRCGLTPDEIEDIRQIIKPGAELNPFKQSVQFRNHLIFELMLGTGIRRGELLKIKLNHLPIGPKTTVSIVRAPDDKDDPRRNEPQVKTRMREIPLHKELRIALWKYAQKYRKGRNKCNVYLFTSTRGEPLNSGAVNWIFSFLVKKRLNHLKGKLSPHVMRHTFNEKLVKLAESLGWSEIQIKELQRYLNGWSEQSEMPTRYTRRIIETRAMEIAERYQETLYGF
jgi:integrase